MTTVILLIYLLLPVSVKEYVTDSFLLNSEYDITSGRMSRNEQAIHFLENNLLWGNINKTSRIDWIHNYPLLQLYDFGVIGGFPVLCLYFYILFIILKYLFKSNIFDIRNIGFILPIVPFGISLAEPTYPFGPGTVNVFYFIAFGIALRCHYDGVKNHPTEK
jgi:hypothetical protein